MAQKNYTITADVNAANNKSVQPYTTGTYLCSAALSMAASGLSSFQITGISVSGNTTNITISANAALPFTVTASNSAICYNVIFANINPIETTFAQVLSTRFAAANASLDAAYAADNTAMGPSVSSSSTFTLSSIHGWRATDDGRVWSTHAEHKRMRNLAYI
jgi:hypothetical protein